MMLLLLAHGFVHAESLVLGEGVTDTRTPINYSFSNTFQGCQLIYTSDELTAFRGGAEISSISFFYENTGSTAAPKANIEVRIGTANVSAFASNTSLQQTSASTLVATSSVGGWAANTSGWVTINFSKKYVYTGGNLLIDIRNTAKTSTTSSNVYFTGYSTGAYKTLNWTGASTATVSSISSGNRTTTRPNIQFNYTFYSALTGESGITIVECTAPGQLASKVRNLDWGQRTHLKVVGTISGLDLEQMDNICDYDDDAYYTYLGDLIYLDLSEATIEDYTS